MGWGGRGVGDGGDDDGEDDRTPGGGGVPFDDPAASSRLSLKATTVPPMRATAARSATRNRPGSGRCPVCGVAIVGKLPGRAVPSLDLPPSDRKLHICFDGSPAWRFVLGDRFMAPSPG